MTDAPKRRTGAVLGAVAGTLLLIASAYAAGAWWMSGRMPPGTIVAGIDVDATLGLVPRFGWAPADLAAWLTARIHVEPVVTVDDSRLDAAMQELEGEVARPPEEPVLRYEVSTAVLVAGRTAKA